MPMRALGTGSAHAASTLARGLVTVLRPEVCTGIRPHEYVLHAGQWQKLGLLDRTTAQLVGDDPERHGCAKQLRIMRR